MPSGILMGNIVALGNYDECLSVKGESYSGDKIIGQYCMLYVSLSGEISSTMNSTENFYRIRRIGR